MPYRNIKRVLHISLMAVLIILSVISVLRGLYNATVPFNTGQDFQWDASWLLLDHQNPYKITLLNEKAETDRFVPDRLEANQFPSCLMLLWPYAVFPYTTAKYLWAFSNLLFTFLLLSIAYRIFLPDRSWHTYLIISCMFVIGTPWRNTVGVGQHILFSLSFFMLAVWYTLKQKPIKSGIFLALSFFKYTTVFPLLLYFVYKRQYRPLTIAFCIHLLLHFFAAYWVHESPYNLLMQPLAVSSRLLYAGYLDFFELFNSSSISAPWFLPYLISGATLFLTACACLYKKNDDLLVLCLLSFLSTVVIYHRLYDYVVLIFPLIFLFKSWEKKFFLKVLISLCLLFTWYVSRIIEVLRSKFSETDLWETKHIYFYLLILLWYTTIIYIFVAIAKTISGNQNKSVACAASG